MMADTARGVEEETSHFACVNQNNRQLFDNDLKTRLEEAGRAAFCRPRTITTCRDETRPIRMHNK